MLRPNLLGRVGFTKSHQLGGTGEKRLLATVSKRNFTKQYKPKKLTYLDKKLVTDFVGYLRIFDRKTVWLLLPKEYGLQFETRLKDSSFFSIIQEISVWP